MHLTLPLMLAALLAQAAPPTTPPTKPTTPAPPGTVPAAPVTTPAAKPAPIEVIPPRTNVYIKWSKGTIYEANIKIGINSRNVKQPGAPLLFPILTDSASSQVDLSSIFEQVTLAGTTIGQRSGPEILTATGSPNTYRIEAPAPPFPQVDRTLNSAIQMGFEINQTIACYASEVDETAMTSITWPTTWPPEVAEALKPQPLIESNLPGFAAAIQNLSGGNLRQVPPWLAAKEIVRHCCNTIQANTTVMLQGPGSSIRGLDVKGAARTADSEQGTACDLVCVCVAMLKAAGIPARPVIGLGNVERRDESRERNSLMVWAEFFLPNAGWIPFDPKSLQSKGVRSWSLDRKWTGFGNLNHLNKQIPIAHSFTPGNGSQAYDAWSVWGWSRLMNAQQIPMPIELWKSNFGGRTFTTGTFSTPSTIRFTFVNRGYVR